MTTIKLWSDYFFPLYPLVGFDEAVRIAEEHVPTTGTAPEQHSLPRAAHSPDGLCEGVDSTRPDTASAQADRGSGSTEGRANLDRGRSMRARQPISGPSRNQARPTPALD